MKLDHIVFGALRLEEGVAAMRAALGVGPVAGGAHPGKGTCNALWGLGGSYLEVIAPDPEQGAPPRPRWYGLDDPAAQARMGQGMALLSWVVSGLVLPEALGKMEAASRGELHWQLSRPPGDVPLLGGAMPAVIDWQGAVPPGEALAAQGLGLGEVAVTAGEEGLGLLSGLGLGRLARLEKGRETLSVTLTTADGPRRFSTRP